MGVEWRDAEGIEGGEWGGASPPQPTMGSGERRKLPQRGSAPRPKTNLVHSGAVRKPLVAIILSIPQRIFSLD